MAKAPAGSIGHINGQAAECVAAEDELPPAGRCAQSTAASDTAAAPRVMWLGDRWPIVLSLTTPHTS